MPENSEWRFMKKGLKGVKIEFLFLILALVCSSLGLATAQSSATTVVLYASEAPVKVGNWQATSDSTAAGGARMANADLGGAKLVDAQANPSSYFEMTFTAQAGTAYRLWIRGKAQGDSPYNDSVFVQFSGSVDAAGSSLYRIGTTSSTCINLEEASGYGLSGWGWQDNGWGVNVFGSLIYFQSTGSQTLRIQAREDGLSIDQIALSPSSYLNSSPGALKNDSTILPSTIGGGAPPPPPPNLPPVVTVSGSPVNGIAPLPVSFSSTASDPDGNVASYSWTFGDGHTSTQPFPSNTYSSAGVYTARLTVTDNQGASASASVVVTVTTPPPPTGAITLKVMTWNSQFGNGTDNVHNLDRQATWISNMNADIVAMYEVNRTTAEDQAQILRNLLTSKTGRNWSFSWIGKFPGCSEGNLILTKWTLVSSSSLYLSYQRSIAQATINVNGKVINFFATHTDPDSASARTQEMIEMKNFAANFAEPRFIAGDFNASPDWPEMSQMFSNYYDSWNEAFQAATAVAYPDNPAQWQTRTRRGRIDYIFHSRGASTLTVLGSQIPDQRNLSIWASETIGTTDDRGVRPSDHNFMVTTYEVR
jgi:endonuclease/exonuclease/phosphatase family metal-dependent hydrolase